VYSLPVLPETMRVDLTRIVIKGKKLDPETGNVEPDAVICEYPGVTAIVKPLDLETSSRWNDEFPGAGHRAWAATKLVKDHLIGFDGLTMKDGDADVPFDIKDERHFRSLPMDMRSGIFISLRDRASVSEETEKNSESPSGSDGTNTSAISFAEPVASPPATG